MVEPFSLGNRYLGLGPWSQQVLPRSCLIPGGQTVKRRKIPKHEPEKYDQQHISYDQHMINVWPTYDHHMINIWPTYDQHMINIWPKYDQLIINIWSTPHGEAEILWREARWAAWRSYRQQQKAAHCSGAEEKPPGFAKKSCIERFHRHMLCLLNNHLPQVLLQWQQIFPQIGHNHSHASGFFGFLSDLNSCRDYPSDNGGDERCDRGLEAKDCGHCCRNWSAHTFKVWKERLGWSVEIIGWCSSY